MPGNSLLLFPTTVLAAKGAICFTCYLQLPKLNKCSGCKRTSYCSQKCQKKDWVDGHKKACKVLVQMNSLYTPIGPQTWEIYRKQLWAIVDQFRFHQPTVNGNDERVLLYQPYCAKCYRATFQLPKNDRLKLCQDCFIASYCSSCSATSHDHACAKLFSIAKAEMFAIDHYSDTGESTLSMQTEIPRSTYRPLSTAKSWYEYFAGISDKGLLISGKVSADLEPVGIGNDMRASALMAASDKHSMILTIIAALEAIFPDLAMKEDVTLHVIGATNKELDALMLFEEMLHLLPKLKKLLCSFVGPQLPQPVGGNERIELDCCPPCTNARRTRAVKMFKGTYHEYLKDKEFNKPDLGVVFHSGHSQEAQEQWRPTIEYLAGAGHPTMFTTFNEKEMMEEVGGLRKMKAELMKAGEKNKWMGMRPLLDPLEEVEASVYHNNMYWYIISGNKET